MEGTGGTREWGAFASAGDGGGNQDPWAQPPETPASEGHRPLRGRGTNPFVNAQFVQDPDSGATYIIRPNGTFGGQWFEEPSEQDEAAPLLGEDFNPPGPPGQTQGSTQRTPAGWKESYQNVDEVMGDLESDETTRHQLRTYIWNQMKEALGCTTETLTRMIASGQRQTTGENPPGIPDWAAETPVFEGPVGGARRRAVGSDRARQQPAQPPPMGTRGQGNSHAQGGARPAYQGPPYVPPSYHNGGGRDPMPPGLHRQMPPGYGKATGHGQELPEEDIPPSARAVPGVSTHTSGSGPAGGRGGIFAPPPGHDYGPPPGPPAGGGGAIPRGPSGGARVGGTMYEPPPHIDFGPPPGSGSDSGVGSSGLGGSGSSNRTSLPSAFTKALKLKQFSGEPGEDATEFMRVFDEFAANTGVDPAQWGGALMSALTGAAHRWAGTLPPDEQRYYPWLRFRILDEYCSQQRVQAAHELHHLVMPKGGSVEQYSRKVARLVDQAFPGSHDREQMQLHHLLRGMPRELVGHCVTVVANQNYREVKAQLIAAEHYIKGDPAYVPPPSEKKEGKDKKAKSEPATIASAPVDKQVLAVMAQAAYEGSQNGKGGGPKGDRKGPDPRTKCPTCGFLHTGVCWRQHPEEAPQWFRDMLDRQAKKVPGKAGSKPARAPDGAEAVAQREAQATSTFLGAYMVRVPAWDEPPNTRYVFFGREPARPRLPVGWLGRGLTKLLHLAMVVVTMGLLASVPRAGAMPLWVPELRIALAVSGVLPLMTNASRTSSVPAHYHPVYDSPMYAHPGNWTVREALRFLRKKPALRPTGRIGRAGRAVTTVLGSRKVPSWNRAQTMALLRMNASEYNRVEAQRFMAYEHTSFGTDLARAKRRYSSARMRRQTQAENQAGPGLTRVFSDTRPQLGALVNLDLGAVAIPEGIVMASSSKTYFFEIFDGAIPQWQDPDLKHPHVQRSCSEFVGLEDQRACLRAVNTDKDLEDCPMSRDYQDAMAGILAEETASYEGSFGTEYARHWLDDYCEGGQICTYGNMTLSEIMDSRRGTMPADEMREGREKRQLVAGIAIGSAIMHLVNLGLGMSSSQKISELQKGIGALHDTMVGHDRSLRALKEGFLDLSKEDQKIHEYVSQGMNQIYRDMEHQRCAAAQQVDKLARYTNLQLFRGYVRDTLVMMADVAHTGRLRPGLLSVPQLKKLLASSDETRGTLIHREPSLVYRFARVFVVKRDLPNLRFGYLLEIPSPRESHIFPLYKFHNVGFEQPVREGGRGKRFVDAAIPPVTYMAPLPTYAVYRKGTGFENLDVSLCNQQPGIAMCELAAIARVEQGAACLETFNDRCSGCDSEQACAKQLMVSPNTVPTRSINTVAGVLIRTSRQPPRVHTVLNPAQMKTQGLYLAKSPRDTYWLPHSNFTMATVDGYIFRSQGQMVHVSRFQPPTPFNFSYNELTAQQIHERLTPSIQIAKQKALIEKLTDKVRTVLIPEMPEKPALSKGMFEGAVAQLAIGAIALVVVAIVLFLCWCLYKCGACKAICCCLCRHCKRGGRGARRGRRPREFEDWLSDDEEAGSRLRRSPPPDRYDRSGGSHSPVNERSISPRNRDGTRGSTEPRDETRRRHTGREGTVDPPVGPRDRSPERASPQVDRRPPLPSGEGPSGDQAGAGRVRLGPGTSARYEPSGDASAGDTGPDPTSSEARRRQQVLDEWGYMDNNGQLVAPPGSGDRYASKKEGSVEDGLRSRLQSPIRETGAPPKPPRDLLTGQQGQFMGGTLNALNALRPVELSPRPPSISRADTVPMEPTGELRAPATPAGGLQRQDAFREPPPIGVLPADLASRIHRPSPQLPAAVVPTAPPPVPPRPDRPVDRDWAWRGESEPPGTLAGSNQTGDVGSSRMLKAQSAPAAKSPLSSLPGASQHPGIGVKVAGVSTDRQHRAALAQEQLERANQAEQGVFQPVATPRTKGKAKQLEDRSVLGVFWPADKAEAVEAKRWEEAARQRFEKFVGAALAPDRELINRQKHSDRRLGIVVGTDMYKVRLLMDGGADLSVMNIEYAERLGLELVDLDQDEDRVRSFMEDQVAHFAGKVVAPIYLAGTIYELVFLVPQAAWTHDQFDALVGSDFLARVGRTGTMYDQGCFFLYDVKSNAKFYFPLKYPRRTVMECPGPDHWTMSEGELAIDRWRKWRREFDGEPMWPDQGMPQQEPRRRGPRQPPNWPNQGAGTGHTTPPDQGQRGGGPPGRPHKGPPPNAPETPPATQQATMFPTDLNPEERARLMQEDFGAVEEDPGEGTSGQAGTSHRDLPAGEEESESDIDFADFDYDWDKVHQYRLTKFRNAGKPPPATEKERRARDRKLEEARQKVLDEGKRQKQLAAGGGKTGTKGRYPQDKTSQRASAIIAARKKAQAQGQKLGPLKGGARQRPGLTPAPMAAQGQLDAARDLSAKAMADRPLTPQEKATARLVEAKRQNDRNKAYIHSKMAGRINMPRGAVRGTGKDSNKSIAAAICEMEGLKLAAEMDRNLEEAQSYDRCVAALIQVYEMEEGSEVAGESAGESVGETVGEVPVGTTEEHEMEPGVYAVLEEMGEYVHMVDAATGDSAVVPSPTPDIALVNVMLLMEPKGPEQFMGSHAGPSSMQLQGFPLKATISCTLDPGTQTTVPVAFEESAVRPAADYMVESTPKGLAAKGLVTAKTLINGAQQNIVLPVINALGKAKRVAEGSILGWAFPIGSTDRVRPSWKRTPSDEDDGEFDTMMLRPRPIRKLKHRRGQTVKMVNLIAVEDPDVAAEEPTKVGTDPGLEVPSSDEDEEGEECQEEGSPGVLHYEIKEKTLTRKQK